MLLADGRVVQHVTTAHVSSGAAIKLETWDEHMMALDRTSDKVLCYGKER